MQGKAVKINVSLLEKVFRTMVGIGILLAAFLLAMDTVKATELPIELQEQIIDILDNDLNISVNQTYLENCFSCPYCSVYNINNGTHNIYYFDFYFTKNIGYLYQRYDGRYYYATSMYFEYTGSNRGYITCSSSYDGTVGTGYRLIVDNTRYYFGSVTATSSNVVQSTNFNITGLPSAYSDTYGYDVYSNSTSSYTYNVLISYGDCYLQNRGSFAVHEDTYTPPPSTNTDGLVVYKQSIHNNEYLLIDYSKCIDWTLATNSDYYLGESSFTLDVDGVQETIELDDETYYTYNVNTKKAYFQIPVSFFNAYGYENAVNVFATNISINYGIVVGMPMNFEAHYVDNVWLKRSADIDFEPSEYQKEAEITYQDNISYVEEYNDYIVYNDSSFSMEYNIDQPLYSTVESALASINGTAKTFTIEAWYDSEDTDKVYFLPLETTTSDRVILWDFLIDNPYALYCDVLVVNVKRYTLPTSYNSNTPWEYTHSVGAMVIYTQRYYLRNMSNAVITSLVDVVEYDKTVAQYTYWLYDLAYDKLTNMDENMAAYFTSDLQILNDVLIKLDNINNIVPNLEDILNNILNALLNLDLDMPETDLTGISSQLATIIARLDTIANNSSSGNINNDWYKRYREWLYDETNDNVLNTPHEYMLNTFDDVKSLFDVFAYWDIPETGFWSSAREYLNRMNGNTYNDNINDYLVTGISSQNFYKDNCNTLVWSDINE